MFRVKPNLGQDETRPYHLAAVPVVLRVTLQQSVCERYAKEHLPKKRPVSQRDDRSMMDKDILKSNLKSKKVADVTFSDIDETAVRFAVAP